MKSRLLGLLSGLFLVGCGSSSETDSNIYSDKFSIGFLGIELGACTRDELSRFVAGERVPAISGKLPPDQHQELRTKFSRVLKFNPLRVDEALESEQGIELFSLLSAIFPTDFSKQRVAETLRTSVDDGRFTLLEFVSTYPTETLRVNGLSFMSKKNSLEQLLLRMEKEFGSQAQ